LIAKQKKLYTHSSVQRENDFDLRCAHRKRCNTVQLWRSTQNGRVFVRSKDHSLVERRNIYVCTHMCNTSILLTPLRTGENISADNIYLPLIVHLKPSIRMRAFLIKLIRIYRREKSDYSLSLCFRTLSPHSHKETALTYRSVKYMVHNIYLSRMFRECLLAVTVCHM